MKEIQNLENQISFTVDPGCEMSKIILKLEELSEIDKVIVNGNSVKKSENSYLSFLIDLSKEIRFDEKNIIQIT